MKILKNFCFMLLLILISGAVTGKICGDYILYKSLKGDISFLTFIFSPSQSFIDTYSLLNSANDYKRLAGYYAYKESGMVDSEFLYERYKTEDSDIIRKVIIWTAGDCFSNEKLVDFYRKLYNLSPESIKKLLLTKIKK